MPKWGKAKQLDPETLPLTYDEPSQCMSNFESFLRLLTASDGICIVGVGIATVIWSYPRGEGVTKDGEKPAEESGGMFGGFSMPDMPKVSMPEMPDVMPKKAEGEDGENAYVAEPEGPVAAQAQALGCGGRRGKPGLS